MEAGGRTKNKEERQSRPRRLSRLNVLSACNFFFVEGFFPHEAPSSTRTKKAAPARMLCRVYDYLFSLRESNVLPPTHRAGFSSSFLLGWLRRRENVEADVGNRLGVGREGESGL